MTAPRRKKMDSTFWIMLALAGGLTFLAWRQGADNALEGLKAGGRLGWDILPVMVLAFVAAGMVTRVMPREALLQWMGEDSGWRGMLVGTLAGALTPGGPFVQFPIVATLLEAGAGVGPMMAYVTAWSVLGVNRLLVFEAPLLGWRLALSRVAASLALPLVTGWLTRFIYQRL